ncbi:MAG: cytochrome c [Candidatus Tectomicrobia bacterium]|nr:cytochrome c [Candidatus Tectomicrobia bacterium]
MRERLEFYGLTVMILALTVLLGSWVTPVVAGDVAAGKELYKQRCAQCHGEDGKANTDIAKALKPVPRDHSDGAYMNALDDTHLTKVITEGGTAVGKSAIMPPQADLKDDQVADLIAYMRSLANPPYKKTK